ncbi:MAG: phosphotransferase [Spongiibacteraceae bacterium]
MVETLKTMATKVRFEVDYEDAPASAHRAFCIKGFFGEGALIGATIANSQAEANWYLKFAPHSRVRTPICRYAAIDPQSGHGIVIMEDVVAAGGRFLSALEPYSPDQAAASLDQLARLHAEHWGGNLLDNYSWIERRLLDMASAPWVPLDMLQDMLDGERGVPLQRAIKNAERIQRGIEALAKVSVARGECLIHGDAHAGNLFEMQGAPALIDWQLLQRGSWALDVAYHIAATLNVEDRRNSERDLLREYLNRLRAHGVQPPAWDEAWQAYRTYMLYGFFLWSITRKVVPNVIHEFVKRLGLAVTDLETFELLGV